MGLKGRNSNSLLHKIRLNLNKLFKQRNEEDEFIIKPLRESRLDVTIIAIVAFVLSILISIIGSNITGGSHTGLLIDFYSNCATTLAGMAMTVLLIDAVNSRRTEKGGERTNY